MVSVDCIFVLDSGREGWDGKIRTNERDVRFAATFHLFSFEERPFVARDATTAHYHLGKKTSYDIPFTKRQDDLWVGKRDVRQAASPLR